MSEQSGARHTLTRRNFLKTTGVVAGAAAVASGAGALTALAEDYKAGQPENEGEQIFACNCRPNCFGYCKLNVHVRDGRIVKTSMGQFADSYLNRACLRGLSHVSRIYDPERVKYPMRRAEGSVRGENKWERVSWDDAIDEIGERFSSIRKEYGPQAVMFSQVSGIPGVLASQPYGRLRNALNMSMASPTLDGAINYGLNRVTGSYGAWVANEPKDMANAKTIIVWGNNLTDAQLQEWHCVAEALEVGVKLIVIDPTFTQIASKADWWIPIRPAADTALNLALMNIIFKENLQDDDFLMNHTVAPFLVRSDNGKFLRMSDLGVAPTEGPIDPATQKPTVVDPAAVWDGASNAFVPVDEALDPSVSGKYEVDGIACRTALDLLKEQVEDYTPEYVEALTDVPADDIIKLARICADGPVYHRVGYGPQAYDNGAHTSFSGGALCAVTGNFGKPGASWGSNWNLDFGINSSWSVPPTGAADSPSISWLVLPEVMDEGEFMGKSFDAKALLIAGGNPLNTLIDINALRTKVFDRMDFIVTVDSVMTDTARYSDLVLPCAQWFEVDEITYTGQTHYLQYSEKAIDPLYESKSDFDIVRLIAEVMGCGNLFTMTEEEVLELSCESEIHKAYGISWDVLKEKQGMRYFPDPFIAWEGGKFTTPSGRAEFYAEDPTPNVDQGQDFDPSKEHLPTFRPPHEAWPENPLHEKYPLVCMSERPRYRVHSQWFNTPWLRELDPEPTVKINPIDAESRGIGDGDYVECFNERGHSVAKAVFNQAIRPGTLVYSKNWQAYQHKAGSWSELTSCSFDPACVNMGFMDVLVEARLWKEGE